MWSVSTPDNYHYLVDNQLRGQRFTVENVTCS